jgi:hypothetical protein
MRGYQIEDYLELVIEGKNNMSYIQTHIPSELCHHGILYWDSLLEADNPNSAKSAEQLQHINSHIMFIPWFSGNTTAGHWTLIVRHRNRHSKVFLYHFDSLNNFNNVESHALSYTPLYIQGIDSWQNVKTPMQTEVEYGMRVCLAAALIAKCGGSISSRVKKYKGIENLNEFTRQHVVQSLTAKSLTPIPPMKK